MSKKVRIIFALFCIISFVLPVSSLTSKATSVTIPSITNAYVYTITPNSTEWASLSLNEKMEKTYVDRNTVINMTTEAVM